VLGRAGLLDRFELVLGGDSLPTKKPDPAPLLVAAARFGVSTNAAMMVGDSHHDRDAARRAGYRFVWARYGYGELDGNSDGTGGVESTSEPGLAIGAFGDICGVIERVSVPGRTIDHLNE
jgi:phosphoglycolate phosphatase